MPGDNPYEPPHTDTGSPVPAGAPCPVCGRPMETGHLLSSTSVSWVGDGEGFLRKNILGGKRIPSPNTMFGGRYHGRRCEDCQLYMLGSK